MEEEIVKEKSRMKSAIIPLTLKNNRWGDELPEDIMRLIMKKLFFTDQARFRAVCRRWRQKGMGPFPKPAKQLPWRFDVQYHNNSRKRWSMSDPVYKRVYCIPDPSISTYLDYSSKPQVWASKDGWLLLCYRNVSIKKFELLLYNPFSNIHFELPKLELVCDACRGTFSSSPASSDCSVLVVNQNVFNKTTSISSCCIGDQSWGYTTFNCYAFNISELVYLEGVLYLLDRPSKVLAFDISRNICSMHECPPCPNYSNLAPTRMAESRGDLLLLNFDWSIPHNVHVHKLAEGVWVSTESLGNGALFMATYYSISVEQLEKASGIETEGTYFTCGSLHFFSRKKDYKMYAASDIYPTLRRKPEWNYEIIGYVKPPILLH